jgi:hypothetical protein
MIKQQASINPVGNACTLINGVPYVECRRCKAPVKLIDAVNQKITFGRWDDVDEYNTSFQSHVGHVIESVSVKRVLKTWTGHGCFLCHFQFETLQAGCKGKRAYFDSREMK